MKPFALTFGIGLLALALHAQQPPAETRTTETSATVPAARPENYVLGPDDQVTVQALDVDEIKPARVDRNGELRLPMIGRVKAAGLTVAQLETTLTERLKRYVRDPEVIVSVSEFRSQPVSVFGAVKSPGVHQLAGNKKLIEIISLAGGVADDAGYRIKITRSLEWGPIPLDSAQNDATGQFSVAEVDLKAITEAANPADNIVIRPHDVISVPRAELIYVIGQVQKPGGYVLHERETMSVLQALSLAGGLGQVASPKNARILRASAAGPSRQEIPIDLKTLLIGKGQDLPLKAEDILFIPENAPRKAVIRGMEAALQIGTGLAIYRR